MTDTYYRYEYAPVWHNTEMFLEEWRVIRTTPAGVWVERYGQEKFVLLKAHKKWAHPTKATALEGFIKRRERQIDILQAQLTRAEEALAAAKAYDINDPKPLLLEFKLK